MVEGLLKPLVLWVRLCLRPDFTENISCEPEATLVHPGHYVPGAHGDQSSLRACRDGRGRIIGMRSLG